VTEIGCFSSQDHGIGLFMRYERHSYAILVFRWAVRGWNQHSNSTEHGHGRQENCPEDEKNEYRYFLFRVTHNERIVLRGNKSCTMRASAVLPTMNSQKWVRQCFPR
jgi:hypothetical protein